MIKNIRHCVDKFVSIFFALYCMNMPELYVIKNKDKPMICGICSGNKQYNLAVFLDNNDDAEQFCLDKGMLTETLRYFANENKFCVVIFLFLFRY